MRWAPTPAAGRGRARATEGPERQVDSRGGRSLTLGEVPAPVGVLLAGAAAGFHLPCSGLHFVSPDVLLSGGGKEKLRANRKKEAGSWVSRPSRGPESAQSREGATNFLPHLRGVNFSGTQCLLSRSPSLVAFSFHSLVQSTVRASVLPTPSLR